MPRRGYKLLRVIALGLQDGQLPAHRLHAASRNRAEDSQACAFYDHLAAAYSLSQSAYSLFVRHRSRHDDAHGRTGGNDLSHLEAAALLKVMKLLMRSF